MGGGSLMDAGQTMSCSKTLWNNLGKVVSSRSQWRRGHESLLGDWLILGEKKVEVWTCLREASKDRMCISRSAPRIPILGLEMR